MVNSSPRPPKPKCHGMSKAHKPCGNGAGAGTDHPGIGLCKSHGGNSPPAIIAAKKAEIAMLATQLGAPRKVDPHTALLEEVYRCAGHVQWLHEKVMELGDADLLEKSMAGEHPTVWIRWYQDERQRLVQSASACIKAGVAERQVALMEDQGRILARVIQAFWQQIGLTPDQERRAPAVLRAVLTSIPIDAPSEVRETA